MRGIIVGTSSHSTGLLGNAKEKIIETEYGSVPIKVVGNTVVLYWHHEGKPPHSINHRANLAAMKKAGVDELILIGSAGSLKKAIKPPCFAVPTDYIHLTPPTFFDNEIRHVTPSLDASLSRELEKAAKKAGKTHDHVVYWETRGPRFETKAEIRMMARFADLVGMTLASEATLATELGIPVAMICTVDNYCNGVNKETVSEAAFRKTVRDNAERSESLFRSLLK